MNASMSIEHGRNCYTRRAWAEAYEAFARADAAGDMTGEDLERLAIAAYLIGREPEFLEALERAYQSYVDAADRQRAVRCAFWLGLRLALRGDLGHASGWLSRAQRLLERQSADSAAHGYLVLPAAQRSFAAGDFDAAQGMAGRAAELGDRFGDADLATLARHLQGRCLLSGGRVGEGLTLLDDAMLSVATGNLSPLVTGITYCGVIEGCREVYALDRAREWTSALSDWCAEQPDLRAFTGACLVHRAEIMELKGAWSDALTEAQRASTRVSPSDDPQAYAAAHYQIAELHRLRGDFTAAEEAYRMSSQTGADPQPGLALLRLAQGRAEAAEAALQRVLGATENRPKRARLLPAYTEVLLELGQFEAARRACDELDEIAASLDTDVLHTMAAHVRGSLVLAEGEATAALEPLRHALQQWQRIDAPYLAARVRVLLGLAYEQLGDEDAGQLELGAARSAFSALGAGPDLQRMDAVHRRTPARPHGLTARELQVLRLIAAGRTNKAIADELEVSVKTVDRHVSNLFDKLDVASRAAATAFAYNNDLI
jgi:DNA-binding CsgD family transcriptional regulator